MKRLHCLTATSLAVAFGCLTFGVSRAAEVPAKPNGHAHFEGPLTPQQALATFQVEPGMKVEVVAAEPLVIDPVAVAFDEKGRMFVAENRGYPVGPGEGKPPEGVIAMLEDTNGDGVYDKRTDYVTGLTFPNGVLPWKGGIFVTCAPDVYYFKDSKGDGKVDVRKVVLTGFSTNQTTQLRVSHPMLGLDNFVHLTSGLTGGEVSSPEHPERAAVKFAKSDSRFNPDTFEFEVTAGQAQFGLTFDDFGHRFISSNRNPLRQVVLLPNYLKRNPYLAFSETTYDVAPSGEAGKVYPLSEDTTTASFMPSLMGAPHAGTFTSACGSVIFHGDALTPAHLGNAFVCEPAQNLVQRQILTPMGATFSGKIAQEGHEFLASPDGWFRPVYAANGPDGALYICDMYRKTIDHPQYLPENIRATADFVSGKTMGRIYRVVADKNAGSKKLVAERHPHLDKATAKELVSHLGDANGWVRDTARRLILERHDPATVPALKAAVKNGKNEFARVDALRLLEAFHAVETVQIQLALADKHAGVRENAIQLAESRLAQSGPLLDKLIALANDPDARVRFQCALSLGESSDAKIIPALAQIGVRNADDLWSRAAVLSSVGKRSDEFLQAVLTVPLKNGEDLAPLMETLGQVLGAGSPPPKLVQVLNQLTASANPADFAWQLKAVGGIADGLRSRGIKGKSSSALFNVLEGESTEAKTAREQVNAMMDRALVIAVDNRQSTNSRLAAIDLLTYADYSKVGKSLFGLVTPAQPTELQLAVVRSLGRMSDSAVGKTFVERERWRAYGPAVREAVVAVLVSQLSYVNALLDAMERGDVQTSALNPARRTQLAKHRDAKVRGRAEALFKNIGGADRMKVYEDYKSMLTLTGEPKNGHAVFTRTCTPCHAYAGEGYSVGPDLTGIRNQPKEALLLHILVPDYEIVPGFVSYEVETKDGQTISGLLASETATSVTLRRALGQQDTILRSNIASISSTSTSLMPSELEKTMSRQDLADLLAFLRGEK